MKVGQRSRACCAAIARALVLTAAVAACGCTDTFKRGSFAAWGKKAPPADAQAGAAESPYADPLTFSNASSAPPPPVQSEPAGNAAPPEVQAFLDRLPKADGVNSTELAARMSDEPAVRRQQTAPPAARQTEPPPVESLPAAASVNPTATTDAAVATNAAAQVPVAAADGSTSGDASTPTPAEAPKAPPTLESLTVKAAEKTNAAGAAADGDGEAGRVTNVPVSTESLRGQTLDDAIEHWRTELAEHPDNADAHWRLKTLLLAAGREQEALDLAATGTGDGDGLLDDAVRSLAAVRQAVETPSETDAALAEIEGLRTKLRRSAELTIPNVALCSKVSSFGVYEELPKGALIAGSVNKAVVYCEIRNFHSEPASDGRLRTALASRMELLTPDGQSVWYKDEPEIEDLSRQRREDFFLAKLVTLPASLAAGEYVLKVSVSDRLAKKANEAICPVTIHAPGAVSVQR